jgi:hypothetical protein
MIELAVVQGIEVHLAMLEVVFFQKAIRFDAVRNLRSDGVVGADGLMGRVPEPERLFRNRDVEAAGEVVDRVAGGVAQVVAADRFHDDLDRIGGVFGDQIGECTPAPVATPALACFVASFARAFLDDVFGAAVRAAGDSRVDGRYDNHGEGVKGRCFSRRASPADRQGATTVEDKKTPCHGAALVTTSFTLVRNNLDLV